MAISRATSELGYSALQPKQELAVGTFCEEATCLYRSAAKVEDFVLSLRIFVLEFANYNMQIRCVRISIQYGSIEFNTL